MADQQENQPQEISSASESQAVVQPTTPAVAATETQTVVQPVPETAATQVQPGASDVPAPERTPVVQVQTQPVAGAGGAAGKQMIPLILVEIPFMSRSLCIFTIRTCAA